MYCPQDNKDKTLTDELSYVLLDDISNLQNKDYEIILMGDFNGKCIQQCQFTGKAVLQNIQTSYNGKRLYQLAMTSDLKFANLHEKCKGSHTRILNDQKSAIDYILLSNNIYQNTIQVHIDEEGSYDIDSDHVLMSFTFFQNKPTRSNNENKAKDIWNFNDDTTGIIFPKV